jgi:hypothetical protein
MADNPIISEQKGLYNLELTNPPLMKSTGEPWAFTCEKYCEPVVYWNIPLEHYNGNDPNFIEKEYPSRCPECNKENLRFKRNMDLKKRIMERYDKELYPWVGFLSISLPGSNYKGLREVDPKLATEKILEARKELYLLYNKWWRNFGKKNFPGAIRFFEWTEAPKLTQEHLEDDMPGTEVVRKIHPHLHVMVFQSEKKDIKEIRESILNAGFGDQIDMQWRADCSTFQSIDYCISYTKKDLQIDGRNRQTYGCLYGSQP